MTTLPPIIHVVDDDASFRSALGELLGACGYRVALYDSAEQLLKTLPDGDPGCILLDVQMAGLSGPQLQDRLAELGCRLPIVFVTGHGDIPMTVQTIKAGAEDFLTKPVLQEKLLEVIGRALIRHKQMREQDSRIAALRSLLSRLTPREHEVFTLLVRGKPHKQIAYALGTSERTVKMHRHNVMQKFQVQSLAELAVAAERLGLLSISDKTRKVPSERRKNRNKQRLTFCDDGARRYARMAEALRQRDRSAIG
jgi:FixJ family two-component response regulator